jgi:ABC-2 type transport system ATP-binding protein
VITIQDISFRYDKTKVYEGFSLNIPEGQSCLISGINGVGKSTLLRLMAGVLQPDRGKIIYNSKLGLSPKKKIGFISDRLSLYESLTVAQGINLHKSAFGLDSFDDGLLKHLKIDETKRIKSLSIGQRTIYHLSLVLSARPEILLIDEIIHSIDPYLRKFFLDQLIRLLSERRMTIVTVNVNFHDIENMIDRVILLKSGRIAVDESIDDLKDKVKRVIAVRPPEGLPILSTGGSLDRPDYYIYPFREEYRRGIDGEIIDLNLTEIVAAFIGGEYV